MRILDTAQGDLKAKRGEIARVLRALGLDESYLRSVRRPRHRGGVKLETLGGLLEEAGLEPGAFFARVFPDGQRPSARFRSEARRLESEVSIPATLATVRERHAAEALVDAETDVHRDEIKAIDALRQTDPVRSGRNAAAFVRRCRQRPAVARALGVWASALRVRNRHKLAAVVLGDALDLAAGYRPVVARLIQRAAYITSDRARFKEAAALAEEALVMHTVCGDEAAVGRTLVDLGIFLRRDGDLGEAISVLSGALQQRLKSDEINRGTALVHVGLAKAEMGDLAGAEEDADQASRCLGKSLAGARVSWLRARIARARGLHSQSTSYFEEAVAGLAEAPGDALLATIELVAEYLQLGQPEIAITRSEALLPLMMSLDNEVLQAGVKDLAWSARQGKLTLALAERLILRIEREIGSDLPQLPPRWRRF